MYLRGENEKELTVYRGCQLTREMIDEYRQFQGHWIKWLSFVSTSKDREVAECFSGNTLFIIFLRNRCMCSRDISTVSNNPDEEEVLLNAGHTFKVVQVEKIECHPSTLSEKYEIRLEGF